MKFSELDALEARTAKGQTDLVYTLLKLASEAGEAAGELAEAHRAGRAVDRVEALGELGDVLWCVAKAARILGADTETCARLVASKLARRVLHGKDKPAERVEAEKLLAFLDSDRGRYDF